MANILHSTIQTNCIYFAFLNDREMNKYLYIYLNCMHQFFNMNQTLFIPFFLCMTDKFLSQFLLKCPGYMYLPQRMKLFCLVGDDQIMTMAPILRIIQSYSFIRMVVLQQIVPWISQPQEEIIICIYSSVYILVKPTILRFVFYFFANLYIVRQKIHNNYLKMSISNQKYQQPHIQKYTSAFVKKGGRVGVKINMMHK